MPQISISDQNYRQLQALARPFEDTVDDVLQRLLENISEDSSPPQHQVASRARASSDLMTTYGPIPDGLKLRAKYKGILFTAELESGAVVFDNQRHPSLSSAAIAVLHSTGSTRPTENGWRFWQYFDPEKNNWFSAVKLKQSKVVERLRGLSGATYTSQSMK